MNNQDPAGHRAQLESWLNHLYELLHRVESLHEHKEVIAQSYEGYPEPPKKWGLRVTLLWAIGLMIFLSTVFSSITGVIARVLLLPFYSVETGDPLEGFVRMLVTVIPIALSIGLATVAVFLRNRFLMSKQQAKTQRLADQTRQHNASVQAEEQRIDAQLYQTVHDIDKHAGDKFPQTYLHTEAVSFCLQMVQDHRAETVGQALNLYEATLHQRCLENLTAAQLEEQRRTTKVAMLDNIISAAGHGANWAETRNQGAATRAANTANAQRIVNTIKNPRG